jgi:hypothetical protein
MKFSRSLIAKAGVAAVVLAAAGTASIAQARDHVSVSIGANFAPYYYGPSYVPAPVYYQPAPVYYQPAPVYYEPAPVYYGAPAVSIRYIWSPAHHRYYYMHHGQRHWR